MLLAMKNKTLLIKLAETPQPPVFQIAIRKLGANRKTVAPNSKSQNRGNDLSQSRAAREDRDPRRMETTLNSQILFRLCADLDP